MRVAILIPYFNPAGYRSHPFKLALALAAYERAGLADDVYLTGAGAPPGFAVNLAFWEPECEFIFQKERLVNLAVPQLPDRYTHIVWADSDVLIGEHWAAAVAEAFGRARLVQCYEKVCFRHPSGALTRERMGVFGHTTPSPGFLWGAARSMWTEAPGLFELPLAASADLFFVLAAAIHRVSRLALNWWWGQGDGHRTYWSSSVMSAHEAWSTGLRAWIDDDIVSAAQTTVDVIEHGTMGDRNWVGRRVMMSGVDLERHVIAEPGRALRWSSAGKVEVEPRVRAYFHDRCEDRLLSLAPDRGDSGGGAGKRGAGPRVAILIPYFNFAGSRSRVEKLQAALQAHERVGLAGDVFLTGAGVLPELAANIAFWDPCCDFLWHKERLINLGAARLPDRYTHVVWADSDVLVDQHWAAAVSRAFGRAALVQCFRLARYWAPDGTPAGERHGPLSAWAGPVHPGLIWGADRSLWTDGPGLFELALTGGADAIVSAAALAHQPRGTIDGVAAPIDAGTRAWSRSLVAAHAAWRNDLDRWLGDRGVAEAEALVAVVPQAGEAERSDGQRGALLGDVDLQRDVIAEPGKLLRWSDATRASIEPRFRSWFLTRDGGVESPLPDPPRRPQHGELATPGAGPRIAILIPHFNFARSRSRVEKLRAALQAYERVGLAGDVFLTGAGVLPELAANIAFWDPCCDFLWHKERLINLGAARLPDRYTHVVWADSDVLVDQHWSAAVTRAFGRAALVQCFEVARCLTHDGVVVREDRTIFAPEAGSRSGVIWGANRSLWTDGPGLFELALRGGGDALIAWAAASQCDRDSVAWLERLTAATREHWSPAVSAAHADWQRRIDRWLNGAVAMSAPATVDVIDHGVEHNRSHQWSNRLLNSVEPDRDLIAESGRVLQWSPAAVGTFTPWFRAYFEARDEQRSRGVAASASSQVNDGRPARTPSNAGAASAPAGIRIAVVIAYFNPVGYRSHRRKLSAALAAYERAGLADDVYLSGAGEPLASSAKVAFWDSHCDFLWHTERLINLAASRLGDEYTHVVWADSDVLVTNDWAPMVELAFTRAKLVHCFDRGTFVTFTGAESAQFESAIADREVRRTDGREGLIWGAERTLWTSGPGLFELALVGGTDTFLVAALPNVRSEAASWLRESQQTATRQWSEEVVAELVEWQRGIRAWFGDDKAITADTEIKVIEHGVQADRDHAGAHALLAGLAPDQHLITQSDRVNRWSEAGMNQIEPGIRQYFHARREDQHRSVDHVTAARP